MLPRARRHQLPRRRPRLAPARGPLPSLASSAAGISTWEKPFPFIPFPRSRLPTTGRWLLWWLIRYLSGLAVRIAVLGQQRYDLRNCRQPHRYKYLGVLVIKTHECVRNLGPDHDDQ